MHSTKSNRTGCPPQSASSVLVSKGCCNLSEAGRRMGHSIAFAWLRPYGNKVRAVGADVSGHVAGEVIPHLLLCLTLQINFFSLWGMLTHSLQIRPGVLGPPVTCPVFSLLLGGYKELRAD